MGSGIDCRADVELLVAQLSTAATSIDKDDLSGLAKMHGLCETLAEATGAKANNPCPSIHEDILSVTGALEQLILGEVVDAQAAVALILELISGLSRADAPPPPAAPEETEPAKPAEIDDEVAAKLDAIFEDPAPSVAQGEQPAQPAGQTAPPSDSAETSAEASGADSSPAPAAADTEEPPYEPVPLIVDQKELEFVKGFVEEAGEHLEAIETAVLEVEQGPEDAEKINDLFRPFHTIKGMAGFLNLRDISCLTHEVETLLDQSRKGQRKITPGLIDVILEVTDILKAQVSAVGAFAADPHDGPVPQPPLADMIGQLRAMVAGRIQPGAGESGQTTTSQETPVAETSAPTPATTESSPANEAAKPTAQAQQKAPAETKASAKGGMQGVVGDQSIRVDTGKLDALVDLVGELVIAQTLVSANRDIAGNAKLMRDIGHATKIVRDVQEVAMSMRMVPIASTFQKMVRVVRDVSRKAGKKVELIISGEDTEMDKNMIQQIGDPLVHMVRNSVDHGIEPSDVRQSAAKPETGQVYLSAFHQGGNIVIEIRDDGKGLDPDVLIAKGIEKGLVQPSEELTQQEAFNLVLAPGFSTAAQVTDISGRGVGMDVVRRNIEQLRGKVEITSEKGRGSTFSIHLPLTLAIIDGMVVRVGRERFIIPTITIEQSLRPRPEQITTVQRKGEVVQVRGRLIPLVQLGQLFGLTGWIDPCETMVVIARCEGRLIGLVIEELIDQQQVVIKSLGQQFEKLQGISGAAILGDGRVGLIIEMTGLGTAHDNFVPVYNGANSPETEPVGETDAVGELQEAEQINMSGELPASPVLALT